MAEDKRPMEVDDLYKIVTVEDPRISPDGKWVAFVRVTVDKMENSYSRTIWLRATDGGDPIQLTRGGKDSQPRWSPDSQSLAFTSGRGDKPQIYVLSIASPGGEARQLTNAKNGASSPDWSHDGSRIAYLAGMNIEEKEDMARFILDVNEEHGVTIVLIEHDMGVVMSISDRVAVLDFGSKIADGPPDDVQRNPEVLKAYLGQEHEVVM